MVGKTLGHYEILEPLGKGGMGEVYRARDTKLNRDVAIKVLPTLLADDPERLARLQREAQLLAALNHPNIAAIYGLEDEGEISFLAMELAEGQTLAQRLSDGAIGIDEGLKIALQIAEALEAAHERGIVHRDLKPANIQVATEGTAAGQVKVLDFGLAKAFEADGTSQEMSPDLSHSPTMAAATRTGVIMGTAAYMSPEQARGKPVDKRTDIWAFGCVVFETLTGKRAFQGETVTDILAAIVHQEPQWEALPPETPLRVRDLLGRCLKKQADERLRDVGECRIAVKEYLADPEGEKRRALASAGTATAAAIPWKLAVSIAVATLLVGILGTWLATRPAPVAPQPPVRLDLNIEEDIAGTHGSSVVLSPDGARVAYVLGVIPGARELMTRSLDQQDSTSLVAGANNLDSPYQPFFSPDGQWVGFVMSTELKKVPVTGGTPLSIAQVSRNRGADWGPDETIVFTPDPTSGLFLVSANGGEPEPLTELAEGEATHRWPQFLPGGRAVVFTSHVADSGFDAATIEVVDLETRERKVVHRGGTYGRYVPTGHLVYANAGTLFAMPFDLDALEATGSAAPVVENVTTNSQGGAQFGFSETGVLAYSRGTGAASGAEYTLTWVDREGNTEPLSFEPRGYGWPHLSPEEDRIAVEIREGGFHIWILDLATGTSQPLTFEGNNLRPVWSPDGQWVYFGSDRGCAFDIFRRRADLSADAERLFEAEGQQWPNSISIDGNLLMFRDIPVGGNPDIGMISLDGNAEPRMLIETEAATFDPSISPDGRWFAFVSNETGSNQIQVQEIETQRRRTISTGGGIIPVWSRDGTEIFYWSGPGQRSVVEVTGETEPVFSAPRPLFEVTGMHNQYDVSGDGQRFLGMMRVGAAATDTAAEPATPRINVILNWFEELKQRVPTGGSR